MELDMSYSDFLEGSKDLVQTLLAIKEKLDSIEPFQTNHNLSVTDRLELLEKQIIVITDNVLQARGILSIALEKAAEGIAEAIKDSENEP